MNVAVDKPWDQESTTAIDRVFRAERTIAHLRDTTAADQYVSMLERPNQLRRDYGDVLNDEFVRCSAATAQT